MQTDDNKNKVLVIDDNKVIRKLASNLLQKRNYCVETSAGGLEGMEKARTFCPHVILLDVMMPELDGYEVCRRLKGEDDTRDIPIIMVTSKTESIDKIKGLENGAADYVTKPFDHGELQARVETQVKMKKLLDELEEKNKKLEELVKKDGLTNLYNHRYFHERLEEECNRALRYSLSLSCIMIDIDRFKKINDTYGHPAGDDILQSLSAILSSSIRDVDIAARYGGEEFALLLPHTFLKDAYSMAERIRETVQASSCRFNDETISFTISAGAACTVDNKVSTPADLVKYADDALYQAKKEGRNRVVLAQS